MKKYATLLLSIVVGFLLIGFFWMDTKNRSEVEEIKRLPVQHEGRIKPLDTVARNSLLLLREKQTLRNISPIRWLLDMMMAPEKAARYSVFRIDNPDVLGLIEKKRDDGKYFSYKEVSPLLETIHRQAQQASNVDGPLRDSYQKAVMKLWQQIDLYHRLSNTISIAETENFQDEIEAFELTFDHYREDALDDPKAQELLKELFDRFSLLSEIAHFQPLFPLEHEDPERWLNLGEGILARVNQASLHPGVIAFAGMRDAYRKQDVSAFSSHLNEYTKVLEEKHPNVVSKASLEVLFNDIQPFYLSIILYTLAFILCILSWIVKPRWCLSAGSFLLIVGFLLHTAGLLTRMYLEGRPPVTNLYSSAIFVGWGTVLLGLILERLYRNGIGTAVSTVIGILTLIIALHLGSHGDTMEMMRAVLNSNFWLTTHVITITIGYSGTFLAGFLGCFYILRSLFFKDSDHSIADMVYGIICFSTFFSFVGTVLGGIWADQSWGRFWGWDPKENGALLIVLWNAIILHARWAGLVKRLGLMILAIFGNVVTSFSWFGVNMLGVGLHSYGFTDHGFFWLSAFILSQIGVIGLGFTRKITGHKV